MLGSVTLSECSGITFPAGEDGADEPRGDVTGGVHVGVIRPGQAVGVPCGGCKLRLHSPCVGVVPTRGHSVVMLQLPRCSIRVQSP